MKISKVDQTRAGVSAAKKVEGILYTNPSKNGKPAKDIAEHIKALNEKAKNLYNALSEDPKKNGEKRANTPSESAKDALRNRFNKIIVAVMTKPQNKRLDFILNLPDKYIVFKKQEGPKKCSELKAINDKSLDSIIKELSDVKLKKGLRKTVENSVGDKTDTSEVVKKLLLAISDMKSYKNVVSSLSQEDLEIFLSCLDADYNKTEQIKKIQKSIENQNVKVQPEEIKGQWRLVLSNSNNKNKKHIFNRIVKYAGSDEEEQDAMLLHMKYLIFLYFGGKTVADDIAVDSTDNVWVFEGRGIEADNKFSDEADRLLTDLSLEQDKFNRIALSRNIDKTLRDEIAKRFRDAAGEPNITEEDRFWLKYIEDCAEKVLLKKDRDKSRKLSCLYLCKYTWKSWVSYIAGKYIDMGKGVYNFAMSNLYSASDGEPVSVGQLDEAYIPKNGSGGITSFDYEKIKSEESLNRDIAVYAVFAANTIKQAAFSAELPETEDIMQYKLEKVRKSAYKYKDAKNRVLRYFGGASKWKDSLNDIDQDTFVYEIIESIASVRNASFHYTAENRKRNTAGKRHETAEVLFKKEYGEIGRLYGKKWYSNNTYMFYKKEDIKALMNFLYNGVKNRPAQIPAFNKIINKANLSQVIPNIIDKKRRNELASECGADKYKIFNDSLFFMLKEIYYGSFIQQEDCLKRFKDAINTLKAQENDKAQKDKNAGRAINDFCNRIKGYENNITFGGLCQSIMTEYNMQNSNKSVKTSKDKAEEIYKHYRSLLYLGIKEAFIKYLKETPEFRFIASPTNRESYIETASEEDFLSLCEAHTFENIKNSVGIKNEISDWYITAHFLSPKQLNHLIGSFKSYIQFITDINSRAKVTENRAYDVDTKEKAERYSEIISVLEFVMLYCGQISNNIDDYFADYNEYADFLNKFVDYTVNEEGKQKEVPLQEFCETPCKHSTSAVSVSPVYALQKFCEAPCKHSPTKTIGIYYDKDNPIPNRNVVLAMMYGNINMLERAVDKITEKDIQGYYKAKADLKNVFLRGCCESEKEQKALKKFQNCKNRIELTDLLTYTEIINDLYSQLVSWSYLRERDLLYMQLGYHYIALFFTNKYSDDKFKSFRSLESNYVHIQEGALLYQIASMYTYELKIFHAKDEKPEKNVSTGEKVKLFLKYCNEVDKNLGEAVYNDGLCFFEKVEKNKNSKDKDSKDKKHKNKDRKVTEHQAIINTRNYIDHFKLFTAGATRTLMDLYSEVYDRFFTYDPKLKKSVSFIFKNILLRHFVSANTSMSEPYESSTEANGEALRKRAKISLVESDGGYNKKTNQSKVIKKLTSVEFSYNIQIKEDSKNNKNQSNAKAQTNDKRIKDFKALKAYGTKDNKPEKPKVIKKPVPVPAREKVFLEQLTRILEGTVCEN